MSSNAPKAIAKRRAWLPHADDEQHWQDQRPVPVCHVDPPQVSLPLRSRWQSQSTRWDGPTRKVVGQNPPLTAPTTMKMNRITWSRGSQTRQRTCSGASCRWHQGRWELLFWASTLACSRMVWRWACLRAYVHTQNLVRPGHTTPSVRPGLDAAHVSIERRGKSESTIDPMEKLTQPRLQLTIQTPTLTLTIWIDTPPSS
jgi:hypothetical protein